MEFIAHAQMWSFDHKMPILFRNVTKVNDLIDSVTFDDGFRPGVDRYMVKSNPSAYFQFEVSGTEGKKK